MNSPLLTLSVYGWRKWGEKAWLVDISFLVAESESRLPGSLFWSSNWTQFFSQPSFKVKNGLYLLLDLKLWLSTKSTMKKISNSVSSAPLLPTILTRARWMVKYIKLNTRDVLKYYEGHCLTQKVMNMNRTYSKDVCEVPEEGEYLSRSLAPCEFKKIGPNPQLVSWGYRVGGGFTPESRYLGSWGMTKKQTSINYTAQDPEYSWGSINTLWNRNWHEVIVRLNLGLSAWLTLGSTKKYVSGLVWNGMS